MKLQFINKFFDDGTGAGGGGSTQPTLSDLTDPNYKPVDPNPPALDEAAQAAAAEQEALAKEAKNEDGTLKPGYQEVDGKIQKDPNYKPAGDNAGSDEGGEGGEENDDSSPEAFWEDVDKLRGAPLKVEYPEGVDPLSPEGVYIREKAVQEETVLKFEDHLKKSDPRGYAYLMHRQAGGDDESFFATKTFSLPDYEAFKDSADIQISIYKASLISKGIDPETAQIVVDKDVKDNKLFDKADAAYKKAQSDYDNELKAYETAQKKAEQAYLQTVNSFSATLNDVIQNNKGLNIAIPDTEKTVFNEFFKQHVEYDNGKMVFVMPLDKDLERQIEAAYLLHKKGDLKALIQREAQTQNVKRLKRVVDQSKGKQNGGGDDGGGKQRLTLGQL